MLRPKLDTLSPEMVDQILSEALAVLEDPGVRVHNPQALDLLAQAGAQVDFTARIARIPEGLVRQALSSAPEEFTLFDVTGSPAVHYGGDDVQFDPGSAGITILDSESGEHRKPVTQDFVRWVQLVETLPQIDAQSTSMVCQDIAEEIGDLYRLYVALNFMRKPIITGAFRKDTWWVMHELLSTVRGGKAALAEKPLAVFDVCPSPPLLWSDLTCQNLIDCARTGVPAELVSMPLAGAAAPVTLAASVVQHTAESLSGVVIHQIAQAGSPIVWGGSPAAFDMREGTTPMGAAETWLIDAAYVQVGKFLHLPTHVYMGMSDAKVVDAQCGLESMGGALVAALSGANMVSGAGMLDFETCLSPEKLVIDAEIIGLARRVIGGIQARENPLALDLMREMGHRGEYLAPAYPQMVPQGVLHPIGSDRSRLIGCLAAERRTERQPSALPGRVKNLLASAPVSPLSEDLLVELKAITLRSAQSFGMTTLPTL